MKVVGDCSGIVFGSCHILQSPAVLLCNLLALAMLASVAYASCRKVSGENPKRNSTSSNHAVTWSCGEHQLAFPHAKSTAIHAFAWFRRVLQLSCLRIPIVIYMICAGSVLECDTLTDTDMQQAQHGDAQHAQHSSRIEMSEAELATTDQVSCVSHLQSTRVYAHRFCNGASVVSMLNHCCKACSAAKLAVLQSMLQARRE